jgi:putative thioredoxin
MDATKDSFETDVLERSQVLPVVVDFWADWCGPCKALGPVLEQAVAERSGDVVLAKVDVDSNPELSARYGVSGIPAVKAFRRGQVVAEFVGAQPPAAVAAFLDGLTGPSPADRLLEELRAAGDLPEVAEALDAGDHERALELLLERIAMAENGERDRLREAMLALFGELGNEHPATLSYRRRLASALY